MMDMVDNLIREGTPVVVLPWQLRAVVDEASRRLAWQAVMSERQRVARHIRYLRRKREARKS